MMDHLSNGIVSQWVFHTNEESNESNLSRLSVINNITPHAPQPVCLKIKLDAIVTHFAEHYLAASFYFIYFFTRLVFPNDESNDLQIPAL